MNREIKFRAWNSFKKKMIFGPTDDNPSPSWILALPQTDDFPIPVMQFTGLKDIDNIQIFEGDVVQWIEGLFHTAQVKTAEIIFKDGSFAIKSPAECSRLHQILIGDRDLIVIGNIYENPEFLPK